jgi:Alpha-L-fucosidase
VSGPSSILFQRILPLLHLYQGQHAQTWNYRMAGATLAILTRSLRLILVQKQLVEGIGLTGSAGRQGFQREARGKRRAMRVTEVKQTIQQVINAGPFESTWESLKGYTVPTWYEDAKFGIFIHWGVYSVPAFGSEWYPRNMYLQDSAVFTHHLQTYGPQARFGYKDFIPMFTADKFDPDQWAGLFRRAGAQFVVPVAEHHDGFAMYDCSFSRWNATRMGPRRDLIGELADAVRRQWLVFGLSSHRAEHWWFFHGGMTFDSDVQDARYADLYGPAQPDTLPPNEEFLDDWLLRTCELVDNYQPQLLWFDWWIEQPVFRSYLQQFAAYYYNRAAQWSRGVTINYKFQAFPEGTAIFDVERGQLGGTRRDFWQTDTAISKIWSILSARTARSCSILVHGPTAPFRRQRKRFFWRSGSGWPSTARRSMARDPGPSSARDRRRWSAAASTTPNALPSPARICALRPVARRCMPSRWPGRRTAASPFARWRLMPPYSNIRSRR